MGSRGSGSVGYCSGRSRGGQESLCALRKQDSVTTCSVTPQQRPSGTKTPLSCCISPFPQVLLPRHSSLLALEQSLSHGTSHSWLEISPAAPSLPGLCSPFTPELLSTSGQAQHRPLPPLHFWGFWADPPAKGTLEPGTPGVSPAGEGNPDPGHRNGVEGVESWLGWRHTNKTRADFTDFIISLIKADSSDLPGAAHKDQETTAEPGHSQGQGKGRAAELG